MSTPPDMAMVMKMVGIQRENTFLKSNQASLGKFIADLKEAAKDADDDAHVRYDFGNMIPDHFDSYRGSYDELALGFVGFGYQTDHEYNSVLLTAFIESAEECLSKTFTGYKGGEYRMAEDTPLWCSNYGESGHTYITGARLVESGFFVVIDTCYGEF